MLLRSNTKTFVRNRSLTSDGACLFSSTAATCCLSDKHSRCWHYQMLSSCHPPSPLISAFFFFFFLWLPCYGAGTRHGHLTARWMIQIAQPRVGRIKLAPCWPPSWSTSSTVYPSAVAARSQNPIRALAEGKPVNNYNSWLGVRVALHVNVKGTLIRSIKNSRLQKGQAHVVSSRSALFAYWVAVRNHCSAQYVLSLFFSPLYYELVSLFLY